MDGKDRVEVSKGGLALAQHIAPVYFDNPKVRVVMVGGSVSRGCADQYSDLEVMPASSRRSRWSRSVSACI